jgi:hypothetical protein
MADYRRTNRSQAARSARSSAYYVDGNTVRKLEQAPKKKQQPRKEPVRYEKRKPAYALHYMAFLVMAVGLTVFSCFSYLQANTTLTNEEQQLASLTQDLQLIQVQNQALEDSLNPQVDLNAVYKTATEKFGMVSAGESQIVYYDSIGSDYVRQYVEIPDGK